MMRSTYTIQQKRGGYLIGMFVFGVASIGMLYVAPIGAGFFGMFAVVHLIPSLNPSLVSSEITTTSSPDGLTEAHLRELSALQAKGLTTADEFQKKRQEILARI
jgi:hypothetical protein